MPMTTEAGQTPAFALEVERAIGGMRVQARDRLVARAAHDLRSPLNGIQGWTHVLSSRLGQEGGIVAKALDGIRSGVQQQVQMIGDLTDLLQVMTGELTIEFASVDPYAALERAAADADAMAQTRSVQLVLAEPVAHPALYADAARLAQALRYVIVHCVRCGMEGDVISLRAERSDDATVFHIGDPAPQGGAVADQVMTKTPAALLLAERLVDLHGGRLVAFALDADGIRQGYRVTFPDSAASLLAKDPQAYQRIASVRAQMPRDPLRVTFRAGVQGGDALHAMLRALGCTVLTSGEADATPADVELVAVDADCDSSAGKGCLRCSDGSVTPPEPGVLSASCDPLQAAGMLLAARRRAA
ncbi:HAMP domain-containing histidine kinase [Achromobacter sp. GG226]|uniref:sensor histidine kinase n=1 Tax=Verticiella alkaliphila TaxID=2779529 RepID=UPI001C0CD4D1|nr:histidine kinase dimerization/phospho-acceptor domain-containing protein [Verticiella sp. GG226]MBU4609012.1 HAMP domain-containing histidine kinase [Verticiella sp. GG226]